MTQKSPKSIRDAVAERYGALARQQLQCKGKRKTIAVSCCGAPPAESADPRAEEKTDGRETGCGCGPVHSLAETGWVTPEAIYPGGELEEVDAAVSAMSLGSGDPIALADIQPGETVLDLGSGAGLDCLLASRRTGPTGRVIGVDMTPEMIDLARRNIAQAGAGNIEIRPGHLEDLAVASESVDVVISNCVLNLSPEKSILFAEAFRVLKPGGRFRVADIVWTKSPDVGERHGAGAWPGCVSGAMTVEEFEALLRAAGFTQVRVEVPATGHEGPWANAEVSARKPQ
jgi:arsenite methyltransferase